MQNALGFFVLVGLLGCSGWTGLGSSPPAPAEGEVLAWIGGEAFTVEDADLFLRDALWKRELAGKNRWELYDMRVEAIHEIARTRALEAAAAVRGLDVDAFVAAEVDALGPIADPELRALFENNRSRLPPDARFEDYRDSIAEFVGGRRRDEVVAGFGESVEVEVTRAPPRVDLGPEGAALGPADAPITLVEFSDYQCPFCARAESVIDQLRAQYGEKLRIVVRHLPLDSIHPRARPAAHAAVCAEANGVFWEYHRAVFAGKSLADEDLAAHADALGIDAGAFDRCLADPSTAAAVERDVRAARSVGVSGTPAFFVNGRFIGGAVPLERFAAIIDAELATLEAP